MRTQARGYSLDSLLRDGEAAGVPFSVAGGVNALSIASVQASGARIAVAGSAIYSADNVEEAAVILRAAIVRSRRVRSERAAVHAPTDPLAGSSRVTMPRPRLERATTADCRYRMRRVPPAGVVA